MIRRPPRSTRTDTLCPTRRSSDLPRHPVSRADHAERAEKSRLDDIGERLVRGRAQYLARGIEGDILIAVACARVALQRRGGKARAQQRGILAFLQLLDRKSVG